jgi:hypothetical protein
MKSRLTTYILIVAALAVWGFVAWRLFFSRPAAKVAVPEVTPRAMPDTARRALSFDYADPFLKDTPPPVSSAPPPVQITTPPPPPPPVPPPNMTWAGSITAGGRVSHIFEQGGLLHSLTPGDTLDGYTFTRAFADSVWMTKDGTRFTLTIAPRF